MRPPESSEAGPARTGSTESSQHNDDQEGTCKMGTLSTGDPDRIVSIAPATGWFLRAYCPTLVASDGFFVRWPVALWATIQCPGQPDRLEAFVAEGNDLIPAFDCWNRFYEEGTLVRSDEFCDCRTPTGHSRVPPPGDLCRACGMTVPPGAQE